MPFSEFCDHIGDAIKAVPSEAVIKSFDQTLFSPANGSKDEDKGSKRLRDLIAEAPTFDELPEQFKMKVTVPEAFL